MEWKYLVILISASIALLLILKEVRRKNTKNLTGRLMASVFAVIALALIALPPSYKKTSRAFSERDLVLLTDGFSKDSLSKFSDPLVLITEKNLFRNPGTKNALLIPSLEYYLAENLNIQTINILGFGLPDEELKMLKNTDVKFHESPKPFGFQNVNWPQKIKSGEGLSISGSFNNNTGKEIKVLLKGLSTTLDSAIISPDSLANFKLYCIPRQLGMAINNLIVISGKDTLSIEKIPFEIEQAKPLNILILSSSPDFEINFLKQWLAANNFSVAVRSKISKGKFSTEFLNMEAISLNLQSGSLEKFDVLVSDETALMELNNSERGAIKNQVNAGLGLLIRNEEEASLPGIFGRPFSPIPLTQEEKLSIVIPVKNIKLQLPGNGANYIQSRITDQPLVKDHKNRILINSMVSGNGRIIFSTINNTYSWKLSGNTAGYSSFWSYLLEKASRKKTSDFNLAIAEQFPIIHHKNTVLLQTQSSEYPKLYSDETLIGLEQNVDLSHRWQGYFWPVSEGWNFANLASGNKSPWYVYNDSDWKSVRNILNLQATTAFAQQSTLQGVNSNVNKRTLNVQVPAIAFYLLFLLCCTYLWIETKFL